MNDKEVSELRRRFNAEKANVSRICGCYVNEKKEIISEFSESLGLIEQGETEKILNIMKKALSGTIGKNLINVEFSNRQVTDSDEHRLLMKLKSSALEDREALSELYRLIIPTLEIDGNYMILLACDSYDVFSYTTDGGKTEDSSETFRYVLCAVCPVKPGKPALTYKVHENAFKTNISEGIISQPELGFMFPAFDDRKTNIYNALFYTHTAADDYESFIDAIFKTEIPMAAAEQKRVFDSILTETVSEDCKIEVVAAVQRQLSDLITEHKESKELEPLVISKNTVCDVLGSCGVPEERITSFKSGFDEQFGEGTMLPPQNIVNTRQFEVKTEDVAIRVNPEHSDLVETRVIDGVKYILIRTDDVVEVNGVNIHI